MDYFRWIINLFTTSPLPLSTHALGILQISWFGMSALCWLVVYALCMYRGFKDKVVAMPLIALCLNFGWEFTMSFIYLKETLPAEHIMFRLWVLFDCVLVVQEFMYGRQDWIHIFPNLKRRSHYTMVTVGLILGFAFTYMSVPAWNDYHNAMYAAVIMNIIMSWLFISTFANRRATGQALAGQDFWIALMKFLGTDIFGGLTWAFMVTPATPMNVGVDPFKNYLAVVCVIPDVVYLYLLIQEYKREGLSIWTRKPLHQ